jgi:RNA recognition motif-containing protein
MQRLSISNGVQFVEFPNTEDGMKQAKEFRKTHPEFKGRRIQTVLQMLPSKIEYGKIYFWNEYIND